MEHKISMEVNDFHLNPFLMNPIRAARRTDKIGRLEAISLSHAYMTVSGLKFSGTTEAGLYSEFSPNDLLISNPHELGRLNQLLRFLRIDLEIGILNSGEPNED